MVGDIDSALLIKRIHDRLEKQANRSLRDKDLTMMQVSVLLTLQEAEGGQLSMKELERHFSIAQSTAAGIVSRLEQKGMLEAFGDADDKRIKLVHITASGKACCAEAAFHMERAEERLLSGLTDEERKILNRLLARLAGNLE